MIKAFKYIACCLAGAFALLPLQAQNIIRPKIAGPNNLWVNSYNGVLFFGQTDFETQNSAMPMQLRFYYNSSGNKTDYGYGLGFSMSYEMRYYEDVIGGVDIKTGDGRTDHFTKYGDEYKAPAGVFSTLTRPTFDTYLLTTKDGSKYFFDNAYHHKVTAIEDRYGNRTTLTYQDTLLVEVKDAVGHTITMSYTDGLLTQASSSFSPGSYKYEYDGLRRLRKRIDPMGNVTLYDYSRKNKLDEIIDANGNKTLISYNSAGMVSRLKTDVSDKSIRYEGDKTVIIDYAEPKNVYSYYRWDEKGRAIEKVGLCCGTQSSQKYDDDNNVAQRIDANGNVTNYTYDGNGNMLSLRDPLGYTEQYTYEPTFNQVASYRDKNGNNFTFNYDTKGNLINLIGPLGFNIRYSYNEYGWRTMRTDSKGGVTRITYNSDGTTSSLENPDGGIINYAYDSYGRMTSVTDPLGNMTSYVYDNLGRPTKHIDALGNTTVLSYDKTGNIVRILNSAGNITAYSYDVLGNVTSMTDAMGRVTTYEHDGRGNVIAVVDPLGVRQEFTFNDRNKLEYFINGAGEKTNYDYDIKGNLIAVMQPNGNVISYEYDALDRLVEYSDNMGVIAIIEYDGNGNKVSITDGLERKTTYAYDALNRQISQMLPSGSLTQSEYDVNGNLTMITDALGQATKYEYDIMNRKTLITNALNAKTQFVYDANGNMIRVTDANGNATSYSYDALGQNIAITFANGRSMQYAYNEIGQVISSIDRAGNEFKYNYNPVGNLLTKTYPDGTQDWYTYDAIGQMLSAVNKDATVTFTYDHAGRILSESLNGKTTTYGYDISAGKRSLVYPSGMTVVEQLNARDLISSIFQDGREVVTMQYNAAGQKTAYTYANGITTEYSYNDNGWPTRITDNKQVLDLIMDYDAIGKITQRTDALNSEQTEVYNYDAIGQLIGFKRGSTVENSYQYDLLGNRMNVSENGVSTNYDRNNVNAYTSLSGRINFSPTYDGNGNLIKDERHSYAYDWNNKLVSIDENAVIFKYDALGRRIAKNTTAYYYYYGNQLIEENVNGLTSTSYLVGNGIDDYLQIKRGSDINYFHNNHLGSPMAITDIDNSIIEQVNYDAYGLPTFLDAEDNISDYSFIGNNILFTGREYDAEAGIYYYRARTMHPGIGRFMQNDPLLFVNGMNTYNYVGNMPIMMVDAFGEDYTSRALGGKYGDQAAQWYADNIVRSGKEWYAPRNWGNTLGLFFSSLWTTETASKTASVLAMPWAGASLVVNGSTTLLNSRFDDCLSWSEAIGKTVVTSALDFAAGKAMKYVREDVFAISPPGDAAAYVVNYGISLGKSYLNHLIMGDEWSVEDYLTPLVDAGLVNLAEYNRLKAIGDKWRLGSTQPLFPKNSFIFSRSR